MWPVHTWLPDAAARPPPGGAVLLVGVLDKVGTFGMLTLCLPLFPGASRWAAPVIVVLAVISVLYGALLAIGQSDLKRLIAFTSISHFGFIVLGVFAMTSTGQAGSVLYMVNHGFSTAALFLVGRHAHRRAAAPRGSPTTAACSGSRRCWPARSWWPACRRWRCRACPASSASSSCWWARSSATRWRPCSPRSASCSPRSTS